MREVKRTLSALEMTESVIDLQPEVKRQNERDLRAAGATGAVKHTQTLAPDGGIVVTSTAP